MYVCERERDGRSNYTHLSYRSALIFLFPPGPSRLSSASSMFFLVDVSLVVLVSCSRASSSATAFRRTSFTGDTHLNRQDATYNCNSMNMHTVGERVLPLQHPTAMFMEHNRFVSLPSSLSMPSKFLLRSSFVELHLNFCSDGYKYRQRPRRSLHTLSAPHAGLGYDLISESLQIPSSCLSGMFRKTETSWSLQKLVFINRVRDAK